MNIVNETELNLKSAESKSDQEVLEKYRELTAQINAEISELKRIRIIYL